MARIVLGEGTTVVRPEPFDGADVTLTAPEGWDESKHGRCLGLPVMRRDGLCISRWSLNWRERFAVLFGRRVRVDVASAPTQPPIRLTVE